MQLRKEDHRISSSFKKRNKSQDNAKWLANNSSLLTSVTLLEWSGENTGRSLTLLARKFFEDEEAELNELCEEVLEGC